MKSNLTILCFAIFILSSCRHETTVVESTYPDGSPKRVCVYLGRGDRRELIKETYYYRNRKVQVTGEYKRNMRNGKWVYYYETGKTWSEGYFRNGKNDGKRVTYYPNGRIRYEAHYLDDQRTGIWKFYDQKGKLVKAVNYSAAPKPPVQ